MEARDPGRTARQTAASDISSPGVLWSFPTGGGHRRGWRVADVDLDGQPEVVLLRGGRVVARRLDGTLVWASPELGLGAVDGVADLDRSGRPEVYATGYYGGLYVLSGDDGAIMWHPPFTPADRFGQVFPIQADGDDALELYVSDNRVFDHRLATGRIYDVQFGYPPGEPVTTLDTTDHEGWLGGQPQAAADLDGDGSVEIVTLAHDRVIAYSPRTGLPVWDSGDVDPFPGGLGAITAGDIDEDGRDEVVVATNNAGVSLGSTRRLVLLEVEEGSLRVRWELRLDPAIDIHAFPRRPIAQIIPGGPPEIVTSYYDGHWRTVVIDGTATTPEPAIALTDRILLAVADTDGDGTAELFTQDAAELFVPTVGTVRAHRILDDSATELWRAERSSLPLAPLHWDLDEAPVTLGGGAVILFEDQDADGKPDRVVARSSSVDSVEADLPSAQPVAVRPGPARTAIVSLDDGSFAALGRRLELLNDGGDGAPALSEPSYLAPSARVLGGTVVSRLPGGLITALVADPAGGPPAAEWRSQRSALGPAQIKPALAPSVLWWERQPDGDLAIARARLDDGLMLSPFVVGGPNASPLRDTLPVGDNHLAYAIRDTQTRQAQYFVRQLDSGAITELALDSTVGFHSPMAAVDIDRNGREDVAVVQSRALRSADIVTGELLATASHERQEDRVSIVDLDDDGAPEILRHGATGVTRLSLDLAQQWDVSLGEHQERAAVAMTAEGARIMSVARAGSTVTLLHAETGGRVAESIVAGGSLWRSEEEAIAAGAILGRPSAPVGIDDLAGDGTPAFLFGATDGYLYAVNATDGVLLWSLGFGATVGVPVPADIDSDGTVEILVCTGDGQLHAVTEAVLSPPEAVYDTDGTFVATDPSEDLDEIGTSTSAGASWTSVAGATDYEVQLLREDELVVVPWTDVGGETSYARSDLVLQPGWRYHHRVRAYDRSGTVRVSPIAISDGFVVLDDDPPTLELEAAPNAFCPARGEPETAISATMTDDVRLSRFSLWIESAEGNHVADLTHAEIGGTEHSETTTWDGGEAPDGPYVVAGRIEDAAGHVTEARALIDLCPPLGAPDGGLEGAWQVDGGGCACEAAEPAPATGFYLWLVGGAVLLRRRRLAGRTARGSHGG